MSLSVIGIRAGRWESSRIMKKFHAKAQSSNYSLCALFFNLCVFA